MSEKTQPNAAERSKTAEACYRAAVQAVGEEDFPGAVAGARAAVRMDPDNAAYRLLLADALAEVHKYDESTRLLFSLLERGSGPESECLYLLGSNCMACGDYDRARACFLDCLRLEPNGPHAEEIRRLLSYVQAERSDSGLFAGPEEQNARRLAVQGSRYLESGQYERAAEVLGRIPAAHADLPYAANALALACFLTGQQEHALRMTEEVLAKEPDNVFAMCNMATFLHDLGRMDEAEPYLTRLDAAQEVSDEERYKIAATFCELEQHERAYQHMHAYNLLGQRDTQSMFYEAVAAFNTGRLRQAAEILSDVSKIEEPPVVSDYFLALVRRLESEPGKPHVLPYLYKLPLEEARRHISYFSQCLRLDDAALHELWNHSREFESTLLWLLDQTEENTLLTVCTLIAGFGDAKAEEILRGLLLRRTMPDTIKEEIAVLLSSFGAPAPYVAHLDGAVTEIEVHSGDAPPPAADLTAWIEQGAAELGQPELRQVAMDLSVRAAQSSMAPMPAAVMAAAALWLGAEQAGKPLELAQAARLFGTDPPLLRQGADQLMKQGETGPPT